MYAMNGVTCGDEVAFRVSSFDPVSVRVVPKNGTGKCKYRCLYTGQFFYQLRATTATSFQMVRTLRSRNASLMNYLVIHKQKTPYRSSCSTVNPQGKKGHGISISP